MRRVIVNEFMSLDGVVQAPGAADEDTSGGFEHGGWHLRYLETSRKQRVVEGIVEAGGFLLGRRTYEIFAAHWPNASEEEQVIAEPLNTKPEVRRVDDAHAIRSSGRTRPFCRAMSPRPSPR